jgi:acylphosphatase
MAKNLQMIITGKVENTGFRFWAFKRATELHINGMVRQEPGKVVIVAEGEESDLETFTYWCRKGPSTGVIDTFHVSEGSFIGYRDFRIM